MNIIPGGDVRGGRGPGAHGAVRRQQAARRPRARAPAAAPARPAARRRRQRLTLRTVPILLYKLIRQRYSNFAPFYIQLEREILEGRDGWKDLKLN